MKTIVSVLLAIIFMGSVTVFAGSTGIPDTKWYDENPAANEFIISTADQLAGLALISSDFRGVYASERFVNKTITLANDIDLSAYASGRGWTPIDGFSGVFDGNNKAITGLRINDRQWGSAVGLFGVVVRATIKNLSLIDVNIIGSVWVGGLVASSEHSTIIENCYVSGMVRKIDVGNVGGIVGGFGGDIKNSYFEGTVVGVIPQMSSPSRVGGIAGYFEGNMENCFSAGEIRLAHSHMNLFAASDNSRTLVIVGGLVGSVAPEFMLGRPFGYQKSSIKNSYTTMAFSPEVFSISWVGGIVGASSDSDILNNVALNPGVENQKFERVVSGFDSFRFDCAALSGNYAHDEMIPSDLSPIGHDQLNGEDVSMQEALTAAFWTDTMGWDKNIWIIKDGTLPRLRMCCTYENPCADCFVNPPTGVSGVTGAMAAMFVFLLMSAAFWAYALINKTGTELSASE
jgi:hypothetical protein